MKTTAITNTEICIRANQEKAGDWENVKKVAKVMAKDGYVKMDIVTICEDEQMVQLFAVYETKQAELIRDMYKEAKALVLKTNAIEGQPEVKEMVVVSYGGGTNSTAMLIGMYENDLRPDAILFADTGGEMPHTYKYLNVIQQWLAKVGFPAITIVKDPTRTLEVDCITRECLPSIAYGGFKTCSLRFKVTPQEKWLNSWEEAQNLWGKGYKITKAIGFDADEPQRAKHYETQKYNQWFPLLEWDWGREECIEAIARAGLSQPGKSSCFFCPNMRKAEILKLKDQYPDLAKRAIDMEAGAQLSSIKGLGRDWAWADLINTTDISDFKDKPDALPCGCYDGDQ